MPSTIGYTVTPPLVSLIQEAMGPDREVRGLTELATLTGLTRYTLSLIMRHKRNFMHADTARRIAEALDIDLADMREASRRQRRKPRSRQVQDTPDVGTSPEPQDITPDILSALVALPPRARRLSKVERVALIETLRESAVRLTDAALDA